MKVLVLVLIFSGCTLFKSKERIVYRNQKRLTLSGKLDRCTEKYIKYDIEPEKVIAICESIFQRR